jgi:asparagine synthase (glutamine-hydrolysing)
VNDSAVRTVRFHATRCEWRITEIGESTVGVLAPQLSEATLRQVLRRETSAREVIDALRGRTELAAFSHGPHEGFRLHTDLNRSFPLYWRRTRNTVEASDDHRVLAAAPERHRCADSMEQFAYSGFTVGTRTMHDEVECVPADAEVRFDAAGVRTIDRTQLALPGPGPVDTPDEAGEIFLDALRQAAADLVSENPQARFLLPLSGGSDSRLLALALKEAAPAHLSAFTYGVRRSSEVRASRSVAEALGIPWTSVELSAPSIRRRWRAPENASFLARAHAGNALPHIQDWYALSRLHEQGLVTADTIILPGHTAARSYTPPRSPGPDGGWSREQILDTLLAHHFNQRSGVPSRGPLRSRLAPALDAELPAGVDRFDELSAARQIQTFNIQHRQVKYILNSVRTYEHFSARWAMPLLDARCHQALNRIDWSVRQSKEWYRALTDGEMRRLAGGRADGIAPLAHGPRGPAPAPASLSRAGALTRSARSVLTNLRHPMAFEAYAPSRREYASLLARRHSPLGVFAQVFLEGRWNPWYRWDDRSTWDTPPVISLSEFSIPSTAP